MAPDKIKKWFSELRERRSLKRKEMKPIEIKKRQNDRIGIALVNKISNNVMLSKHSKDSKREKVNKWIMWIEKALMWKK